MPKLKTKAALYAPGLHNMKMRKNSLINSVLVFFVGWQISACAQTPVQMPVEPSRTADTITPALVPLTAAEKAQIELRAEQLSNEAGVIRKAAGEQRTIAEAKCWDKTFVNACLNRAREAENKEQKRARVLDIGARTLLRDLHRREAFSRVELQPTASEQAGEVPLPSRIEAREARVAEHEVTLKAAKAAAVAETARREAAAQDRTRIKAKAEEKAKEREKKRLAREAEIERARAVAKKLAEEAAAKAAK